MSPRHPRSTILDYSVVCDAEVLNALALEQAGILWGTTADERIVMSATDWAVAERLGYAVLRRNTAEATPNRLRAEPSNGTLR